MNSRKLNATPNAAPNIVPRGFSIVELMVAIVLLAISAALALPSYRELIEKRQITYGAEQLMAFVNAAQSESIKQNSVLTVSWSRTADNDWCVGAVLGNTACDCAQTNVAATDFCAIDSQAWVINNSHAGNRDLVTAMEGDGAYSFNPVRGLVESETDDPFFVVGMSSNGGRYNLEMSVSRTGQVGLCNSIGGEHPVPGYAVCENVEVEIAEETPDEEYPGETS